MTQKDSYGIWYHLIKRLMDIVMSLLGILLSFPLWVLIALCIRADSKGPIIFKQVRIGKGGKSFVLYKFRSMQAGAEEMKEQLKHLNVAEGPIFKIKNDPRVTRVGRLLRRSTLDELPQLINVLKGQMSLVGPRPPLPEEVAVYTPLQRKRLEVTPGLTCLWQVSGRSEISFSEWVQLDLYYIQHQSFLLDVKILIRTLPAVLSRRGAY
ncbi:MAG: sugar transferase [Candidatus Omnitrophica bacterium]|nr:sugar transferase [Candidatus Omnitrophota bacterium]